MAKGKAMEKPILFQLIKAAFIGSAASLVLILILAAVMWKQLIGIEAIPVANAVIKVLSAALAGFAVQRHCQSKAWLCGAMAGLIYAGLAYTVFAIISGSFTLNAAMLSDALIGMLSGMISAMITRAIK